MLYECCIACNVSSDEDLYLDFPGFRREAHGFNTKSYIFMNKTYKNSKATIIVSKNIIDRFCIPKLPQTCEIAVSGDFLGRQYSDHPRVLRFSYNFLYSRVQFR